jgi:hypothetical protein
MKAVDDRNEDYGIATYALIPRQRFAKHIPAEANARKNRTLLLGSDIVNIPP